MKHYRKHDLPVDQTRRFLEPGPIVLVSSQWKGEHDIMTMGWHMMLGYDLIGTYVRTANHSYDLIRKSKECVINLPTLDIVDQVVGVENTTGAEIDKFKEFGFTPQEAEKVKAPLIAECYANFECRLHDGTQIKKHSLFIWQVVKAHVATSPEFPKTVHYRGDGRFMTSGQEISLRRKFKTDMLRN